MAIGTPTSIGSATGATQVSSGSFTTTGAIPAGALVIVNVSRQNVNATTDITSVTDGTNTYVAAGFIADGGQNQTSSIWYTYNAATVNSGGTLTVNGLNLLSSGPGWSISAWVVTGIATSSPLDGTPGSGTSNATPWATGTLATNNANDLLWVLFGGNQNEPTAIVQADCLPTSGWTNADALTYGPATADSMRTAYNIVSATGSYKGGGTLTVGNAAAYLIAAFKAAPTAPVTPTYGVARGQWPNAPYRVTQRPNFGPFSHNNPVAALPDDNDVKYAVQEQFYGQGTNNPVITPRGATLMAPLRSTQRPTLTTQQPGYNGVTDGQNQNDETVGNVQQFYGVLDIPTALNVINISATLAGSGSMSAPVVVGSVTFVATLAGTGALTAVLSEGAIYPTTFTGQGGIFAYVGTSYTTDPNPLISKGVPAYAIAGSYTPAWANDRQWSAHGVWNSVAVPSVGAPVWLDYDLSGVSAAQRALVTLWWTSNSGDYWQDALKNNWPQDYSIWVNAAAGGTDPTTGWVKVVDVVYNEFNIRRHVFSMTGYNWVRFQSTASGGTSPNNTIVLQMNLRSCSDGLNQDAWLFLGDSITREALDLYNISGSAWVYGPLEDLIGLGAGGEIFPYLNHQFVPALHNSRFSPEITGGGVGATTLSWCQTNFQALTAPIVGPQQPRYCVLAFGTNDCNQSFVMTNTNFAPLYTSLLSCIDQAIAAGFIPIYPTTPWGFANAGDLGTNAQAWNTYWMSRLPTDRPACLIGPDLWTLFYENQGLIDTDGIHPKFAPSAASQPSGLEVWSMAWHDWMMRNIYSGAVSVNIGVTLGGAPSLTATLTVPNYVAPSSSGVGYGQAAGATQGVGIGPLRITQRTAFGEFANRASGIFAPDENDIAYVVQEYFYGVGTNGLSNEILEATMPPPRIAPRGATVMAPLRSTQRMPLTTVDYGYNGLTDGTNENDLTSGNVSQFYGTVDVLPNLPVGGGGGVAVVATLSGQGSLSETVSTGLQITVTLNGTGALTALPEVNIGIAVTLPGTGSLTALPEEGINPVVTLAGVGSLTALPEEGINPAPTFNGTGSLTAAVEVNINLTVTFNGTGSITATGLVNISPTVTLSGAGSITATVLVTVAVAVTLGGTGSISAIVNVGLPIVSGTLAGAGSIVAAPEANINPAPTFTGAGSLTATVSVGVAVTTTFGSAPSITVVGLVNISLASTLAGQGSLVATVVAGLLIAPTLSGAGSMAAAITVMITPGTTLSGTGVLNPPVTVHIIITAVAFGGTCVFVPGLVVSYQMPVRLPMGSSVLSNPGTADGSVI